MARSSTSMTSGGAACSGRAVSRLGSNKICEDALTIRKCIHVTGARLIDADECRHFRFRTHVARARDDCYESTTRRFQLALWRIVGSARPRGLVLLGLQVCTRYTPARCQHAPRRYWFIRRDDRGRPSSRNAWLLDEDAAVPVSLAATAIGAMIGVGASICLRKFLSLLIRRRNSSGDSTQKS
jgi:hypothetical protein